MSLPIGKRPFPRSTACERTRYARSIYLWTLSQWDENRADIERRTATVALDAILAGERVGISSGTSSVNSVDDKMGFFQVITIEPASDSSDNATPGNDL